MSIDIQVEAQSKFSHGNTGIQNGLGLCYHNFRHMMGK